MHNYEIFTWDCIDGLKEITSDEKHTLSDAGEIDILSPEGVLDYIIREAENEAVITKIKKNNCPGRIYLLLDFGPYISNSPDNERRLKKFAQIPSVFSIVLTGVDYFVPPSIEGEFELIDFPYPNSKEIDQQLEAAISSKTVLNKLPMLKTDIQSYREEIIKSALGLTLTDAKGAFAKSIVSTQRLDIPTILKEKQNIIRKKGYLEYHSPEWSLSDIGGLDNLREWIKVAKITYLPEAKKFDVDPLRGLMLVGVPGTGKSLSAKVTAGVLGVPLLRLDFGRLFGSHVGQSERQSREVISLVENLAPCVLWLDEIEKGIAGSGSSDKTDGGTASRVIGTWLTWLEEREKEVFIVATANRPQLIPPEFMRSGRFDAVFFVDVPNETERRDIFSLHLRKKNRNPEKFDMDKLVDKTEGYSGAEIRTIIQEAIRVAFFNNRGKKT